MKALHLPEGGRTAIAKLAAAFCLIAISKRMPDLSFFLGPRRSMRQLRQSDEYSPIDQSEMQDLWQYSCLERIGAFFLEDQRPPGTTERLGEGEFRLALERQELHDQSIRTRIHRPGDYPRYRVGHSDSAPRLRHQEDICLVRGSLRLSFRQQGMGGRFRAGRRLEGIWENDSALHYYVHGKDNIPFHSIIWPSILMAAGGLHLPDRIISSEYLTLEKKQFSKSRHWAVWLPDFLAKFDPETLRYYLVANGSETSDADFSWEEFAIRTNKELIGTFGNFIHRSLLSSPRIFRKASPSRRSWMKLRLLSLSYRKRLLK
jgi:hypothetical protein